MEKKTKIVFYCDKWLSGGIESFIMNIYRNIDMKNINIDVLVSQDGNNSYDEEIKKLGGNKYITLEKKYNSPIKRTIFNFSAFYKKVKKLDIDIIHINLSNAVGMIYGFLAKKAGVKHIIFHSHNSDIANGNKAIKLLGHKICKKMFEKYGDYYLACSDVAAKFMYSKKKIESGKIKIIKNGIKTDKFKFNLEDRNEYRKKFSAENKLVIGTIGRMSEQKNQEFLLRIFKEINNKNKETKLVLIGEGEKKSELEQLSEDLHIKENVCFFGVTDFPEKCLSGMDVFVLPSLFEGNPVVGIEAQTNGLKCLFSDTITREAKITDLVKFLSIKDIEPWVEEILKLNIDENRKSQDEEIRKKGFDVKQIAIELKNLYLSINKGETIDG